MTLHCKSCKAELTEALWRDQGEYFIPCFGWGVRNIVLPVLQIVGYRKETPFPIGRRPSGVRSALSVASQAAPATRPTQAIAGSKVD